jgi:hypothetical protein
MCFMKFQIASCRIITFETEMNEDTMKMIRPTPRPQTKGVTCISAGVSEHDVVHTCKASQINPYKSLYNKSCKMLENHATHVKNHANCGLFLEKMKKMEHHV